MHANLCIKPHALILNDDSVGKGCKVRGRRGLSYRLLRSPLQGRHRETRLILEAGAIKHPALNVNNRHGSPIVGAGNLWIDLNQGLVNPLKNLGCLLN